jgi:DNA repair protein RadC
VLTQEAGDLLGIPLLDHNILSDSGFISLVEAGHLVIGKG